MHADGTLSGGPMHYLPKGLADCFGANGTKLGKVLSVLAPFMILFFGFFGGNLFQVNQSYAQLVSVTGGEDGLMGSSVGALLFGILIAAIVGIVASTPSPTSPACSSPPWQASTSRRA